ncbi:glutamate receptor U1-like [Penaeus japonicus]|uniref:glutamate receptor U1-like n=1 Tax=Penaeus japonicus TaxID=27405 RepID=UPI001C70E08A|nr:glutamate receptor U1-like [Penaeus japonicus]
MILKLMHLTFCLRAWGVHGNAHGTYQKSSPQTLLVLEEDVIRNARDVPLLPMQGWLVLEDTARRVGLVPARRVIDGDVREVWKNVSDINIGYVVVLGRCAIRQAVQYAVFRKPVPIFHVSSDLCDHDDSLNWLLKDTQGWSCLGWVFHGWLQRTRIYGGGRPSWLSVLANETPQTRLLECGNVSPRNWSAEYVIPGTEIFSRVERELANATLTFATVHRPPFTMLEKRSGSSEIVEATGFCFSMLELLAKQLGFKYRLKEVPDGSFGAKDEDGNWNGMVGMVVRGEADGAIGSFTISHARSTAVDFTAPFFEDPTGILLPEPTSGSKMTAFLAPFSWQVWVVTAVLVVVVGTLLSLLSARLPLLYPHQGKTPNTIVQYITYTAKALLSQSNTMRQTNASRVLHCSWWLLVLTLIYSYSGTLIASLTAPKLVKIADSLEELVDQQEIPWTVKRGSVHETLFVRAQSGTYGKVGDLLRRQPSIMASSNDGGVDMVRTGDHAFIKDLSFLKVAIATDYKNCQCCKFSLAKETFFKSYFAWIMKKGSVYTQVINSRFLQYEQAGLFAKWQKDFFPQDNECTRPSPRGPRSLGLGDLVGCFTLLGAFLTLALIVFIVELLVNRSALCSRLPLTLLSYPAVKLSVSEEQEKMTDVPKKMKVFID